MKVMDFICITRKRALELGFTHEGTLFGVPAWMKDPGAAQVIACPKVTLLQFWAIVADKVIDLYSEFVPADRLIVSPIHVRKPITVKVTV